MQYKIYEHRYTFKGNFAYAADCIKHSLELMGYTETEDAEAADLHVFNHTCRDLEPDMPENSIIFKPTAPTSKHFSIDRLGYANSSSITFEEPFEYEWRKENPLEWKEINDMIQRRANKWDDSIMANWKEAGEVKKDHVLIIGQMPEDETVHGFSFGDHWKKFTMIIDKLKDENLVIKLHPNIGRASHIIQKINKQVEQWEELGHQVIRDYKSIHGVLPYTRVAILENSTAGIECMMHNVPIISYGYPEYHWVTYDLRILTELRNAVKNLNWFSERRSRRFVAWYINDYLCSDIDTTIKRLTEVLHGDI